jgi:hypothetical protein
MGFKEDFPEFKAYIYGDEKFRIDWHFATGEPDYELRAIRKDMENCLKSHSVTIELGTMTLNRVEYHSLSFHVPHYPHPGSFSNSYNSPLTDAARTKLESMYAKELNAWVNEHIEELRVKDLAKYVSKRQKEMDCMEAKIKAIREAMAAVIC